MHTNVKEHQTGTAESAQHHLHMYTQRCTWVLSMHELMQYIISIFECFAHQLHAAREFDAQ